MLEALRSAIPQISVRGAVADFRVHDVEPNMVVEPRSAEEAAAVLKLASENDWRVECAGMNTQGYGNRRTRADIVISTRAMTAIVEYEPADLVIGVQAGMPLHQLQRETRKNAQFLPLDPAREEMATIGGTLATALSGPLRYAHGTARDHVLGLQVVTGDGRILQLGGRVVKNVAGYDLVRLLVGSAGTLGLITSAYLRLKPLPQADETLQISAAEPQPLLELARYITTANLEAVALELLDAGALTESWLLLVRLAGNQESVADAHAHIAAHAKQLNAETRAAPAADWDALARLELSATTVVRLADLPSRLDYTLQLAQRLMARVNGPCQMAAHAGDGVIRIFIGESTAADTAYVVGEIRELMAVSNGTVTLHSSNAELMRRVDAFGANNVPLALMSRLKQVFDPAGVLAPGRFVV